ncbi:MAG: hypothetical protein K8H84_01740 [Sulfuricella denitrificans]|nr:hypothetical protein [Sulfuricella denitrificans]
MKPLPIFSLLLLVSALPGCVTSGPRYEYQHQDRYQEDRGYRSEHSRQDRYQDDRDYRSRAPIGIQVSRAIYGAGRSCDATQAVRQACEGRRDCGIDANNRLCGDPDPGRRKVLTVEYRCGGRVKSGGAPEDRGVFLRCD